MYRYDINISKYFFGWDVSDRIQSHPFYRRVTTMAYNDVIRHELFK